MMPIVALPADAPADAAYVQWLEVDLRQGVVLNFVNSPQIFVLDDQSPIVDWSFRVGLSRRLQIDIHLDLAELSSMSEDEDLYGQLISYSMVFIFQCLILTLGTFDDDGINWYNKFVVDKYNGVLFWPGLFPYLSELILGRESTTTPGFPDAILAVELRS